MNAFKTAFEIYEELQTRAPETPAEEEIYFLMGLGHGWTRFTTAGN